jgi:hypothetical protein
VTTQDVVLASLRSRGVVLPREGTERLAREITTKVLEHLHRTGALSCPPADLQELAPR